MKYLLPALLPCLLSYAGCAGPSAQEPVAPQPVAAQARPAEPMAANPWVAEFQPPLELDTARMHLEPLGPEHAELDFEAFMSSREHLHATLHWGSWPSEDSTVEGNRGDLTRHAQEFADREAYAYTVQTPDGSRCIGCVYLNPGPDSAAGPTGALAYWIVADEVDSELDRHLLETLLGWFESDWPLASVVLPVHVENERGARLASAAGLVQVGTVENEHRRFVWTR